MAEAPFRPGTLPGFLADFNIRAIRLMAAYEVSQRFCVASSRTTVCLRPLQHLTLLRAVRGRIEILNGLADAQPGANGIRPARLIQDAINGGTQTV